MSYEIRPTFKFLIGKSPSLYYGFVGYKNLGDEAIWVAVSKLFECYSLHLTPRYKGVLYDTLLSSKKTNFLMLGGGTLIGENLADGSNPFRERFERLSSSAKNIIVFGVGVGGIDENNKRIAPSWLEDWRSILERACFVGVRGFRSSSALAHIGIDAEVIGDPACYLVRGENYYKPRKKTIGINIGSTPGLISWDNLMLVGDYLKKMMADGWSPEFYIINPQDYDLTLKLVEYIDGNKDSAHCIYEDAFEYMEHVKNVQIFLGTRLHAVILSMCAGVPSVMLGYSQKHTEFMESVFLEELNLPLATLDKDKIESVMDIVMSESSHLSKNIVAKLEGYREKQIAMMDKITDVFSVY